MVSAYDERPEFPKVWIITEEDHSSTMVSFRRSKVKRMEIINSVNLHVKNKEL